MKRLLFAIIMVSLVSTQIWAQKNGGRQRQRMTVEQQVSQLKEQLSLDDEQTKTITALYNDFDNMIKSGEVSREHIGCARQQLDKQVREVLTDTQKEAFDNLVSKRGKDKPQKREQ